MHGSTASGRRLAGPSPVADPRVLQRPRRILVPAAFAPLPRVVPGRRGPTARAHVEGTFLVVEVFAVAAATWAVLMAIAPLLQVRRMLQRRSSADVSLGYLFVLLPGFALWVAYGVASKDIALVIPNVVAFIVAVGTVACALHLRSACGSQALRRRDGWPDQDNDLHRARRTNPRKVRTWLP